MSPRQLHIRLQATLAEADEHRLVLQGLDLLQPSGVATMLSGKRMCTITLLSSSLLQPYRVGFNGGESASIVTYDTMAGKCTLFKFFLKNSCAGSKYFKGGAVSCKKTQRWQ